MLSRVCFKLILPHLGDFVFKHKKPAVPQEQSMKYTVVGVPSIAFPALQISKFRVFFKVLKFNYSYITIQVCKLFYQIAHGSDLWRSACKRVWPEAPLKGYGTWRDMWIRRPHLRFDGNYWKVNYFLAMK